MPLSLSSSIILNAVLHSKLQIANAFRYEKRPYQHQDYLLLLSSLLVYLGNEISNLTLLNQAVQMQNCLVSSGEDSLVLQQIEYLQSPTGQ